MTKQYGGFQQWVEWVGVDVIPAVKNMEANFPLNLQCLRELRGVATPEAAKSLLPCMLKDKVSRKDVEAAIQVAIHDMFVDWSWSVDNPFIHPDRRVPSSSALGSSLFTMKNFFFVRGRA